MPGDLVMSREDHEVVSKHETLFGQSGEIIMRVLNCRAGSDEITTWRPIGLEMACGAGAGGQ